MRASFRLICFAASALAFAAPAYALFPAGNPLTATIPTSNLVDRTQGRRHHPQQQRVYAVDVDDLIQRDDFSNVGSLYNGLLAPFVKLRLVHNGQEKSLLQIIRDASGNQSLSRTDLRFGLGPDGEIYVLNKHDG